MLKSYYTVHELDLRMIQVAEGQSCKVPVHVFASVEFVETDLPPPSSLKVNGYVA